MVLKMLPLKHKSPIPGAPGDNMSGNELVDACPFFRHELQCSKTLAQEAMLLLDLPNSQFDDHFRSRSEVAF